MYTHSSETQCKLWNKKVLGIRVNFPVWVILEKSNGTSKINYKDIDFLISAVKTGRENSGIPDWYIVEDWIEDDDAPPYPEEEEVKEVILNNPEIRKLENYYAVPEENFWENFPHR